MASETQPVPVASTREYLRVVPTADPLTPETVTTQFQQLHQLRGDTTGLLDRLRGPQHPVIEVCLTTDGDPTTPVEYYLGTEPAHQQPLTDHCRRLFPDSYELTRVQWSPTLLPDTDSPTAIEWTGECDRPRDWQTRLTPFERFQADDHSRVPLAGIAGTLADCETPALVQLLVQPLADWHADLELRRDALAEGRDTLGDQLMNAVWGPPEADPTIPAADQERLEELAERNARRSFVVNARAVLAASDRHIAEDLATAFSAVGQTCHEITGQVHTGDRASEIATAIHERTLHPPNYDGLTTRLPGVTPRSRGIVADASELGSFCLLDGSALTTTARRALDATPAERTTTPRPPAPQLDQYREPGLPLGRPLTQDDTAVPKPVRLPPALQPMHVGWVGKTGAGKSTGLVNAILENQRATDGADILIDPKGDGMAQAYLRAHYAEHGTLENVLYFDCTETLPAIPIFDIRRALEAGIPRPTAAEDTVDHYLEMLRAIMGADRFEQAVRSPDIIRYLAKALFDPVNGADAYAHADLEEAARELHERETAPTVSDEDLERMLAGVVANGTRSFDEIMQGVANRLEKIPADKRLARIFNHVPDEDAPRFDLADYLDEDVVIVLDTGGLRSEAQRVLTLVVLSNLWTALRRRAQTTGADGADANYQLVNVYLEEAPAIASSDILQELLAQSRSFGCALTLAMQFPEQLRAVDEAVYRELLNNVSTYVVGNVPVDDRLAQRLATADTPPSEVRTRLGALRRGEWLVGLPAPFDEPEPRPFQVESLPLPPGHPDRADAGVDTTAVTRAMAAAERRTRETAGLTLGEPSTPDDEPDESAPEPPSPQLASPLPYTRRLPETVTYDGDRHALVCTACDNRYDTDIDGMRLAIDCCGSLKTVDRADVPVCGVQLKLTPEEREASEWSPRQLLFLQAVYNAQQQRFDPLEYDLVRDSMVRLQEYTGVDSDAVQDLIDAGLVTHDTDHPHRLYTVTPKGRDVIGEQYRRGIEYGHGAGDLEESSEHVLAVELGRRYLEQEYVADSDSDVAEVVTYYEPDRQETAVPATVAMGGSDRDLEDVVAEAEQRRLDAAGLDSEGEIVAAVEAERVNHDVREAVMADFDKIAACNVEAAIWVVPSQAAGHEVLAALNDPPKGEPRVEKSYAAATPPQHWAIDTPGLTAMFPVGHLQGLLDS